MGLTVSFFEWFCTYICLPVLIFSQSHFGVSISVSQSKNAKSLGLAQRKMLVLPSCKVLNLLLVTPPNGLLNILQLYFVSLAQQNYITCIIFASKMIIKNSRFISTGSKLCLSFSSLHIAKSFVGAQWQNKQVVRSHENGAEGVRNCLPAFLVVCTTKNLDWLRMLY